MRLRISRQEARRRIADAHLLARRTAMTGEKLAPLLPHTAAGVAAGTVGVEHVRTIATFWDHLPSTVDPETRAAAEAELAGVAAGCTPDELSKVAARLMALLDQDGTFTDGERARKRGITIGKQGYDGMSRVSGWLDPEARATFEAVQAKLGAPGMCNPDRSNPRVGGTPTDDEIRADLRSPAQRTHDALKAGLRALLASGKLGQHRGLPVSIVISTTLQDLESARGHAVTAGGTLLPMSDVIRMARHAHHYLAVFDKHTNVGIYLGRSKRIASPGQRIMLYGRERGCSRPGCTAGGYWCEVNHCDEWAADDGKTDITTMTLACPGDHRLLGASGWTAKMNARGQAEWTPPPDLDGGGARVNTYHHPERFLTHGDDSPQDRGG